MQLESDIPKPHNCHI